MKITVAVITPQDYEKFNAVGMNAEACLADRVKLICQDDAGHVAESFMKQDEFDRLGLAYIEQHAKLEHSEVCDEWFMKCSQNSWYNDLERNPEKVIKVMFVGIEDGKIILTDEQDNRIEFPREQVAKTKLAVIF